MDPIDLHSQAVHQLDESVWRVWQQKDRRKNERATAARVLVVKCFAVAAMLATMFLWIHGSPFEFALKAVVAGAAVVVLYQAISMHRYGLAAMFGCVAVVFNPFLALVVFAGVWERAVLVVTVGVFAWCFVWLRPGLGRSMAW